MIYKKLPTTDLEVSLACLGTMSFGSHVEVSSSEKIMSRALELGVNFFDTAELYSVPTSPETYGDSERIIGTWMKKSKTREKVILATKVAGGTRGELKWIRNGASRFDEKNIRAAIEGSLSRLQTDYIDLYQLHWPDRPVNKFGERYFPIHAEDESVTIEKTLTVLQQLQNEGKVKHFGISNETPWGTMKFLQIAKQKNLPRVVTTQNNYSLLTRTFDVAMSEVCKKEDVGLLSYSPLGYGVLGGRYLDGNRPAGGRLTLYPKFAARYRSAEVESLIKQYKSLAESVGITLPQLALAFVYQNPCLTSNVIGPSNTTQLEDCVKAMEINLSEDTLKGIDAIDAQHPNICP